MQSYHACSHRLSPSATLVDCMVQMCYVFAVADQHSNRGFAIQVKLVYTVMCDADCKIVLCFLRWAQSYTSNGHKQSVNRFSIDRIYASIVW